MERFRVRWLVVELEVLKMREHSGTVEFGREKERMYEYAIRYQDATPVSVEEVCVEMCVR